MAKKKRNIPQIKVLRYFNERIAVRLGVYEAIIIQQIDFWLRANEKNDTNSRDGYYWTFNSIVDWSAQFPFWNQKTTERILKRLRDEGYLITTNKYNHRSNDKTLWYRINYELLPEFTHDKLSSEEQKEPEQERQTVVMDNDNLTPPTRQTVVNDHDKLSSTLPLVSFSNPIVKNIVTETSFSESINKRIITEEEKTLCPGLCCWGKAIVKVFGEEENFTEYLKVEDSVIPKIIKHINKDIFPYFKSQDELTDSMQNYIKRQIETGKNTDLLGYVNYLLNI